MNVKLAGHIAYVSGDDQPATNVETYLCAHVHMQLRHRRAEYTIWQEMPVPVNALRAACLVTDSQVYGVQRSRAFYSNAEAANKQVVVTRCRFGQGAAHT